MHVTDLFKLLGSLQRIARAMEDGKTLDEILPPDLIGKVLVTVTLMPGGKNHYGFRIDKDKEGE